MESDASGPSNVVHCSVEHGLHLERDRVKALLEAGDFFWLDIHEPQKDDLAILREEFHFHPLSLEDSWRFDQRRYSAALPVLAAAATPSIVSSA